MALKCPDCLQGYITFQENSPNIVCPYCDSKWIKMEKGVTS